MRVAVTNKNDERLVWALYRAMGPVDTRWGGPVATVADLAEQLKETHLSRNERFLLLRAWQLLAWNQSSYYRLVAGYDAMYHSLCDQSLDYLDSNAEINRACEDAELLPVMIEAYDEARAARPAAVKMPKSVNVKMGGDKVTRAMLQGMNMMRQDCIKALREQGYQVEGE